VHVVAGKHLPSFLGLTRHHHHHSNIHLTVKIPQDRVHQCPRYTRTIAISESYKLDGHSESPSNWRARGSDISCCRVLSRFDAPFHPYPWDLRRVSWTPGYLSCPCNLKGQRQWYIIPSERWNLASPPLSSDILKHPLRLSTWKFRQLSGWPNATYLYFNLKCREAIQLVDGPMYISRILTCLLETYLHFWHASSPLCIDSLRGHPFQSDIRRRKGHQSLLDSDCIHPIYYVQRNKFHIQQKLERWTFDLNLSESSMDLVWTKRRGKTVRLSIWYNFNNPQSPPTALFNIIHSFKNRLSRVYLQRDDMRLATWRWGTSVLAERPGTAKGQASTFSGTKPNLLRGTKHHPPP